MSPSPKSGLFHFSHLDGVRALAACYVVLFHIIKPLDLSRGDTLDKFMYFAFSHGHAAVNVFITLSGFCLMLPIVRDQCELRGGALSFYRRRIRRILPPYYIALVLFALLWFLLPIASDTPSLSKTGLAQNIISHVVFVHDFSPTHVYAFNGAFWSIAVEFRIYLLFPFLLLLWRRLNPVRATLLIVSFSLLVQETLPSTFRGETFHYFGLFALGMLAAEIAFSSRLKARRLRERPQWQWVCVNFCLFALSVGVNFAPVWKGQPLGPAYEDTLMGFWAASVFVSLTLEKKNIMRQWLSWSPLCLLGAFAYSIYLVHMPLLGLFVRYVCVPHHLTPSASWRLSVLVAFPAVLVLAYVFFLVAEKPFLSAKLRAAATAEQAAATAQVAA